MSFDPKQVRELRAANTGEINRTMNRAASTTGNRGRLLNLADAQTKKQVGSEAWARYREWCESEGRQRRTVDEKYDVRSRPGRNEDRRARDEMSATPSSTTSP